MSTAYYREFTTQDGCIHAEVLGVMTFEKAGQEQPRKVFTWEVNPATYLWDAGFHFVIDEMGNKIDRNKFVTNIVATCEVQRYDEKDRGRT